MLETSLVSVPANPGATVFARAFPGSSPGTKSGQVLAGVHADALERAHRRLGAARRDIGGVLSAAGRLPADDGSQDPEADEDEELAFEVERRKREADRRRRLVAIAKVRFGPLSSAEKAAVERARFIERARRGP